MKIYLAGPMRGREYYNFPTFEWYADRARECGYEVVSPAAIDIDLGFDPYTLPTGSDWSQPMEGDTVEACLDRDIAALKECEEIYLLPGWSDSYGAKMEAAVGEFLGMHCGFSDIAFGVPSSAELWEIRDRNRDRVSSSQAETVQTTIMPDTESEDEMRARKQGTAGFHATGEPDTVSIEESTAKPAEGDTVTNDSGGKQSHVVARYDALDPTAHRMLAECLGFGAEKYGLDNWRNIPIDDHLNHLVAHVTLFREGDRSEPHLANAMARAHFAAALHFRPGDKYTR